MQAPPSLVWLPADHRWLGDQVEKMPFWVLGDKYAQAANRYCGAQCAVFPLARKQEIEGLLDLVDGVLLTGSPSNVHPSHFGAELAYEGMWLDTERDAITLPLVSACLRRHIPLLGICRGFQEINVAMGGTLLQEVHAQPGLLDHREEKGAPFARQYGLAHDVRLEPDSRIARWAGAEIVQVNSLHGQGIDRLAEGLRPVAYAPDGLIEAVELCDEAGFACGVQWHPEWQSSHNHFYDALLSAFGTACKQRYAERVASMSARGR